MRPLLQSPQPTDVPAELESEINESFTSLASLRTTMLHTAAAMFGPGFVWLVAQRHGYRSRRSGRTIELGVLNTYLAGSPHPGAHFRQQSEDRATMWTDVRAGETADAHRYRTARAARNEGPPEGDFGGPPSGAYGGHGGYGNGARRFSTVAPRGLDLRNMEAAVRTGPAGIDLEVLLCVSTWEHVYMWDYGPWGKSAYLERWWDRIDWPKVNQHWVTASAMERIQERRSRPMYQA